MATGEGYFYRPRRSLGDALAGASEVVGLTAKRPAFRAPRQTQQPLPPPTGQPPFRLDLAEVIGAEAVAAIEQRGGAQLPQRRRYRGQVARGAGDRDDVDGARLRAGRAA